MLLLPPCQEQPDAQTTIKGHGVKTSLKFPLKLTHGKMAKRSKHFHAQGRAVVLQEAVQSEGETRVGIPTAVAASRWDSIPRHPL